MGDLLKHKIQHRPDRTELIRQHILEGNSFIDDFVCVFVCVCVCACIWFVFVYDSP